jgi:ATP/maltotriose-dependent transcriptional regulator MalT
MDLNYQNKSDKNNEDGNLKNCIEKLLSNQEIKIIKLASNTFSNKEIAQILFLAESTVKKHRENAYLKLNIQGRENVRQLLRQLKKITN